MNVFDEANVRRAMEDVTPERIDPNTFHDAGNAERVLRQYGEDLLYCDERNKWLVWDGKRWIADTAKARFLAKQSMLTFLQRGIDVNDQAAQRFARQSLDERRIDGMLGLACIEPWIRVSADKLDARKDLLNVRNGTLDLRTGELRAHDRSDLLTKQVHHDYDPAAECPQWDAFLERIMGAREDEDRATRLIAYLRRALGYSLSGDTSERAVFILYGDGRNGKSTLLNVFKSIVSEYAVTIAAETLMTRQQQDNNTSSDLADLHGARFAQTSETEEGQRFAQGKLKRITQGSGSQIRACRKYENPFSFEESHKLWVDTNHKPVIQNAEDQALFGRLHPIPFTVQIPEAEIDRELAGKLLSEAPGILAWAVRGGVERYRYGLGQPKEVRQANQEWRQESDRLSEFIEECCATDPEIKVQASVLYRAYSEWADANREHPLTSTAFGRKMISRSFERDKTREGWFYRGIGIRSRAF